MNNGTTDTETTGKPILDALIEASESFAEPADGYQAGALISSSWGYDQTNYDFFKIVKRKGDWLSLIPLGSKILSSADMRGTSVPGDPIPTGGDVSCIGDSSGKWNGKPIRRRLCFRDGKPIGFSIKHGWARLWDGEPKHWTAYA